MKQFCFFACLLISTAIGHAQNVGIGTTTPVMPLHISRATDTALLLVENRNGLDAGINTGMYLKNGGRYTGAIKTIGTSTADARLGLFTFSTGSANSLRERLSILDDGKVGIGTTDPTALLDVNGSLRLRNGAVNGNVLTADASGNATWKPVPNPSNNTGFSVTPTVAVSVANTFSEKVPFNNKSTTHRFDDGNSFSVSTNAYIAPADGVYSFTMTVGIAAGTAATDGHIRLSVTVNEGSRNTPDIQMQTFAGKPLPRVGSLTVLLQLFAGDAVSAQIFNNSGTTITTATGSNSVFTGFRVY